MIVSIIVAYDKQRGIGRAGTIPWRVPEDLALFKRLTWGHHIVMGSRTYESIERCLPGRINLVVTRQERLLPEGCVRAASLEAALAYARDRNENECFVIGGGMLYRQALPLADRLYISQIDGSFDCDVFFPPLDTRAWVERLTVAITTAKQGSSNFTFRVLDRCGLELPLPDVLSEWEVRR